MSDDTFKRFNSKLIPNIDPETVLGVKTPQLRNVAKELIDTENYFDFISDLPHKYFEENQIHIFAIAEFKDFYDCINKVETFLPYIDNWATCDQLSPRVFSKHKKELLVYIKTWITSAHTYTIRFAVNMLMKHFLDCDYDNSYSDWVAEIEHDDYYVNMVRAWYFATAIAKQKNSILPYLEEYKLDVWTHNKTIQKAVESYRIDPELKEYLKTLKIKKG